MPNSPNESTFGPIPEDWKSSLESQRTFVSDLARTHFPDLQITRTTGDFEILQKILDMRILQKDETWKLQALGVAFGDAVAGSFDGFAWCYVTDEFGSSPTLRFRNSTVQLNALTMISKRVERDELPDVQIMASHIADFIRNQAPNYQ